MDQEKNLMEAIFSSIIIAFTFQLYPIHEAVTMLLLCCCDFN